MASARFLTDLALTTVLAILGLGGFVVLGASLPALLLALPLLVILPGYALVAAVFPRNAAASTLGLPGRVGLSVALSLVLVPSAAIVADYTVGIYPLPVLGGLAGLVILLSILALGRRIRLPANERMGIAPFGRIIHWYERYLRGSRSLRAASPLEARSGTDVFLNLVVLGSILVFAASVGIAAVVPQDDAYSEAYLATTNGDGLSMVQDPGSLSGAERESLVAVVENHERSTQSYTVTIVSQQVGGDGTVSSVQTLDSHTQTIGAGESTQIPVPASNGDRTVVDIYKGSETGGDPDFHLVLQRG